MRTKRVEYDKGLFAIDEELEREITSKAKEFVNDILDGIGKEYRNETRFSWNRGGIDGYVSVSSRNNNWWSYRSGDSVFHCCRPRQG